MSKPFLVVVTGLAGAGRSVSLKALEDIGFYCMDNLPVSMIPSAIDFIKNHKTQDMFAIGPDIRTENIASVLEKLKTDLKPVIETDFIFLAADENSIIRRFSTTRRKHPLLDSSGQLVAAIRHERQFLEPISRLADVTFDTSQWSPHYLSRQIEDRLKERAPGRHLHVTLTSFGFKYGMLRPCDTLIDVRFLKNPFFDEKLKELTGLEPSVQEFVKSDSDFVTYYEKLFDYVAFVLPKHYEEGKNYFRLGIGCTGGKHRSVTIAEQLSQDLTEKMADNILVSVHHRDIPVSK
jgi:UPF0042 nucleotide-binding protein